MPENKVVTFGEIMLRLSTSGFQRFIQADHFNATYAGSEANVAVSLSFYGIPSVHVTCFPDNPLGHAATQSLRKHQVDTRHVRFSAGRMGIYFLENGAMQRASQIIYDRFDSAFARIEKGLINWEEVLKDATWFHYTGITPAISQGAADECLKALEVASALGVQISGDINYRRVLWNYGKRPDEIMPALVGLTDIIIAGKKDIENCTGINAANYQEACQRLFDTYPKAKVIATTSRETISSSHNKLTGVLYDRQNVYHSKTYDLTHIVDRVGSGDAFMAGLIFGILSGKGYADALEFGVAAAAWKHSVEGDINLASAAEIENLIKGENVGKLMR